MHIMHLVTVEVTSLSQRAKYDKLSQELELNSNKRLLVAFLQKILAEREIQKM